jgi:S1-C subfamily serine protease
MGSTPVHLVDGYSMRRVTLYSRSDRSRVPRAQGAADAESKTAATPESAPPAPPSPAGAWARSRAFAHRHHRPLWLAGGAVFAFLMVFAYTLMNPAPRPITQDDIDLAVRHTLETQTLPSQAAKAYDVIRPSVVMVRDLEGEPGQESETVKGIGSGVVIVDKGIILTNLHVVAGASRVGVEFFDGTQSEAMVIATQPENDLAVLQAKTLPDDLVAATLRSTADLAMGDEVVAVGFPFGIGPSVTSGVVSGLRREYRSPEGKRLLTNLIQFDAAANPGSSGGPLVTAEGEVVGIVTGILNPTSQRVFIGIGFAVPIENAAAAFGIPPF